MPHDTPRAIEDGDRAAADGLSHEDTEDGENSEAIEMVEKGDVGYSDSGLVEDDEVGATVSSGVIEMVDGVTNEFREEDDEWCLSW